MEFCVNAGPKRSALQQMLANLGSDDDVFSSQSSSYQGGAASSPQRATNSAGSLSGLSGSDSDESGRHDRRGEGSPPPEKKWTPYYNLTPPRNPHPNSITKTFQKPSIPHITVTNTHR